MEFVLTLSEGLARVPTKPSTQHLDMMASTFLVPLEYETLNRILCPRCARHDWEGIMHAALVPRGDLEWPYHCPAGDRHRCRCRGCGHSIEVTFWFTK